MSFHKQYFKVDLACLATYIIKLLTLNYWNKLAELVGLRFLASVFAKGKNLKPFWQRYIWQHKLLAWS